MADTVVRLGNTAPTVSVHRPVGEQEARAAGPLGGRNPDGSFYVLDQRPIEGVDQAITTFVIPHGYSHVNAVRDMALAYGGQHSKVAPAWVHSEHDALAQLTAQHFAAVHDTDVPVLSAEDLDTLLNPPTPQDGQLPPIAGGAIQAAGRDLWAQALGDISSTSGTATGTAATTLTDTTKAWTTNQWAGKDVICGGVIGTILSNTATVLTVARWETPGSRAGAVAATPAAGTYVIESGQCPAYWMACTANNTAPSIGGADTTLTGEITVAGSGFLRAVPVWAHTTGTNAFTLTITFTATGSDTFPQNINKIGVLNAQNGGRLLFETLLSATFTANQAGDNVQVTDTITGT